MNHIYIIHTISSLDEEADIPLVTVPTQKLAREVVSYIKSFFLAWSQIRKSIPLPAFQYAELPEKPKFNPPSFTQDSSRLKQYQAEHLKKIEEWKRNLEVAEKLNLEHNTSNNELRKQYLETLKAKLVEFQNSYTSENIPPCSELPELIRTSLNFHTNWPEKFIIQKVPILAKD